MSPGRCYEFGGFRLEGALLFCNGNRVALAPKVVETLSVLVEAEGRIVSKDELMRRVWPDTFVDEISLTSNISVLRKILAANGDEELYIETVSKRGYRFVVPVRVVAEDSPAPPAGPVKEHAIRNPRTSWMAGLALVAVVVFASLSAWQRFAGRGQSTPRRIIVAVLPVQNLTGDPERDYIGDGLTEEIIAELSRSNPGRLGVIARTSAMAYKGGGKTVQQIGRELQVDFVVESSLRAVGDRLRITAQLVRVQDQTHLWSADYNRTLHDLFSLEDEVAQAIALNIGVKLATATQARPPAVRPVNPDAYLAYLEGRYYWNRRSPEALERAIVHFQQAIEVDPSYALAYAGLADAYASQCLISDVRPQQVFAKAKAAALKALELDPALAEAHTSLAYLEFWYDWDWAGAEAEFKRALDLNPGYATAHQWYAEFLRIMGRQEEAIAENRKALELDPLSLIMNMEAGLPYYLERRFDEAIPHFRKTLDLDPNFGLAHCVLAWSYEGKGQYAAAIGELERARRLDDSSAVLSSLGHAYAMAGRHREAENILSQLRERAKTSYVSPFFPATIYVGLGDNERALDLLDEAYANHDWVLPWVNVGLTMDPLHSDARFRDLLRRLNLPPRPEQRSASQSAANAVTGSATEAPTRKKAAISRGPCSSLATSNC